MDNVYNFGVYVLLQFIKEGGVDIKDEKTEMEYDPEKGDMEDVIQDYESENHLTGSRQKSTHGY